MGRKKKPAHLKAGANKPGKPRSWDKACSAAYLRLLGATQEKAAQNAGCSLRALRAWESMPWWQDAIAEARQRWLNGCDTLAMNAIVAGLGARDLKERTTMARWWADRRIPELKPPKQQPDVAPNAKVVIYSPDNGRGPEVA